MALQKNSSPRPRRGVTLLRDADGSETLYGREKEVRDTPTLLVVECPHPGIEGGMSDAGGRRGSSG
jgi:hypothetical protein